MYDPDGFVGDHLYLDANVFIYGMEGFKPYDEFLRKFFVLVEERAIRATTSEITLAEVLVAPLRHNMPNLAAVYQALLSREGPIGVVAVSRDILLESAAVRARSSAKPLDAIHIATASSSGVDFFISDDRRLDPSPITTITLEELVNG